MNRTAIAVVSVVVALVAAGIAWALAGGGDHPGPPERAAGSRSPHPVPTRSHPPTASPTPTATPLHPTPSSSPSAAASTPSAPPVPQRPGFALWPSDTVAGAGTGCGGHGWRDDVIAVAQRFAAEQLGWRSATVVQTGAAAGTQYVTLSRSGHAIDVAEVGGYPGYAGGYPGSGCFSVVRVQPAGSAGTPRSTGLHVTVRGTSATVRVRMLGARAAEVTVAHGDADASAVTTTGRATLRLSGPPAEPGYVLVRYRDGAGRVIGATGEPLPSGDVSR